MEEEAFDIGATILNQLPFETKTVASVGYVAIMWSGIEYTLFEIIGDIFDLKDQRATVAFAEMTTLQRLNIITSAMHHARDQRLFELWCSLETRIDSLRTRRNDVIHGIWEPPLNKSDKAILIRVRSRRKVTFSEKETSWASLLKLFFELHNFWKDLCAFKEDLKIAEAHNLFKRPVGPPLDEVRSTKARAQDQARARKKSVAQACRDRARNHSDISKDKAP